MNKGDLFTVYMEGAVMTVCVIGFYEEEYSGEEMVILAVINQEDMVSMPLNDIEALFPKQKRYN